MSQENVEIVRGVRTPISVSIRNRRRTLDERIFLLFPVLARLLFSAWSRLPPRSRLRRALLARLIRQGNQAANRRDFDVLFLGLDPELELRFDDSSVGGLLAPDMLRVYHGHEGYRCAYEAADEVWEGFTVIAEEVIDFGDRLVTSGRYTAHGGTSGIPMNQPVFQFFLLRRGLVFRQEDFADRDKALAAAGLSE
jgi:ketosteroid isomerase-like protein